MLALVPLVSYGFLMTDTLNGEAIRLLRGARGWSLRAFAARVEISPPYLSKIETGMAANVSPRIVGRIAHALDVPTDALRNQQVFAEELAKILDRPEHQNEAAYWDAHVVRPAKAVA